MPDVDLGQFRLHYRESGVGIPLVFLHGFTLDSRLWLAQASHFSSRFRVLCPDARGHGRSDAPETGYGRDDRVEDLRQFADTLQLDRFHLVGLSMGGSTAIGFALKHQERLRSMALVSTGAAGYRFGGRIEKIDQLAREQGVEVARRKWMEWSLRWFTDERAEIYKQLKMMMAEHSGAIWRDKMRGRYPRTFDLDHAHRITVPTAVFAGGLDRMFLPLAEQLHRRIPNSTLRVLEGVGHMINMEIPELFNQELEAFLKTATES